jgi:hypothetical protein
MIKARTSSFLNTREKSAVSREISQSPLEGRSQRWRASVMVALASSALLSLGLAGCGSNSRAFSSTTGANADPVVATPSDIDFGEVKIGTGASQNISIKNSGTSPVQITELGSSSSAFTVSSTTLPTTLAAGQSLNLKIHYDAKSTADSTGTLDLKTTSLSTMVSTSSSSIKLHGKGSNSGTPSLSGLSCSSSSMIGAGSDNCSVTLTGAAPSTGLAVNLASSSTAVAVPVSVIVPSGAKSASFAATVAAVSASQTVTLTASQGSTSKTAAIKLSGSSSAIAPSISSLTCGSSTFTGSGSTTCTVALSLAALSGGQGIVLTSNTSAVSVPASVTIPAGASSASFSANISTVSATQTASLTAAANASSKSFALKLNAATASLSLSSTSLAFGNVSVGTAVTKSITMTSNGTVAVSISADSIAGTGFSVSGGSFPLTLNPGQALVLSVQFNPKVAGSVTGQLAIASNAPSASVSLSGTGSTTVPTVSGLACGSTSITGSLADSCTVALSGSAPTGGVIVALASSSGSVAVPSSVTVPATATSATFTASVAAVTTAASATLTATSGSTSKSILLQLNAATPALTVNASTISFGAVVVDHSTTQTVTLTSSGTAAVTVNSISVTGTGFSTSSVSLPAKLNPGQTLSLTLTFSPTATGSASGQLTISSNSSSNSTVTIGLSGTANPHQVELAWNPPSASGTTITGYRVYRAASGSGGFAALNSGTSQTSFTDSGVQSGKGYDYYVTSIDSGGTESSPSNTTTVSIP